jgi:hypothetical protein
VGDAAVTLFNRAFRRALFGITVAGLVALSGCGPGIGNLSGKVTYQTKTVASGSVILIASDGVPRYCPLQQDGTFHFGNIPAGEVKLGVTSPNPVPDPEKLAMSAPGAKRGGREQQDPITATPTSDPKLWFPIPTTVGDPTQSNIKRTLKRGDNVYNIEL